MSCLLRHVVFDDERRSCTARGVIATVELHVVCDVVIIIVCCKPQAELGGAGLVDICPARGIQEGTVPVADRCDAERSHRGFACGGLEVTDQHASRCAKVWFADIHFQPAENGEGI